MVAARRRLGRRACPSQLPSPASAAAALASGTAWLLLAVGRNEVGRAAWALPSRRAALAPRLPPASVSVHAVDAALRAISADVVEAEPERIRLPPEPRSQAHRTERDVANDVVFGVVAIELLFSHDRLDMEVGSAFRRAVYDPVLERFKLYSDSTTPEARAPAKSWRLQDRVLERQFSLSNYFTEEVAVDLQMHQAGDPLLPAARLGSRAVLRDAEVEAGDDPVSSQLIAWSAHGLWVGGAKDATSICRRRPFGYAAEKPGVSEWLLPVFVEHDRSSHAERMALLSMGEVIKANGGQLHPEAAVRGVATVYASHTPCISCLAVFCQFKRKLPNVRLYFIFDTWSDTRRWIDNAVLNDREDEEGE